MTEDSRAISDPTAIRALAHPTRLALLEVLGGGPATATRCAELTGQSVASCSFHLRTLARHGFIEAVGGPGREKPWRLTRLRQDITSEGDSELAAAGAAFGEFFVTHETGRLRAWMQRRDSEPTAWRRASILTGATAWLTAEELSAFAAELDALVERHFVDRLRAAPAGAAASGEAPSGEGPSGEAPAGDRRPVRLFAASSLGLIDLAD